MLVSGVSVLCSFLFPTDERKEVSRNRGTSCTCACWSLLTSAACVVVCGGGAVEGKWWVLVVRGCGGDGDVPLL